MGEPAMTSSEVMRRLNIRDHETLYALVRAKRLPAVRLGREYRFDPDAVEAFIRGGQDELPRRPERRQRASKPDWLKGVKPVIRRD